MTAQTAVIVHLTKVGKGMTTKELTDALIEGGIETDSKNYYMVVASALKRELSKKNPRLIKRGKKWNTVENEMTYHKNEDELHS